MVIADSALYKYNDRMMMANRWAFFLGILLCLGIGGYAVIRGLPGSGSAAEVAAARQAQTAWMEQRSRDIITQKPWNGIPKPADAPGTPADLPWLVGGMTALLAALGLAIAAARGP